MKKITIKLLPGFPFIELNKLKHEYKLFHVVQGKNKNNEVIVQLTEKEVV